MRPHAFAIAFASILVTTPAAASCRALDGDTNICRRECIRLENADAPYSQSTEPQASKRRLMLPN